LRARGALSLDEAAAALGVSVRELLVDVSELELDGALRRDGAVVSLAR
jgi:DNA-binding Lrp family transcriptional regulator